MALFNCNVGAPIQPKDSSDLVRRFQITDLAHVATKILLMSIVNLERYWGV